jgi:hypothetical protein
MSSISECVRCEVHNRCCVKPSAATGSAFRRRRVSKRRAGANLTGRTGWRDRRRGRSATSSGGSWRTRAQSKTQRRPLRKTRARRPAALSKTQCRLLCRLLKTIGGLNGASGDKSPRGLKPAPQVRCTRFHHYSWAAGPSGQAWRPAPRHQT